MTSKTTLGPAARWILLALIAAVSFGIDLLIIMTTSRAPTDFTAGGVTYHLASREGDTTTLTDARGGTLTLTVDEMGELCRMDGPEGSVTYTVSPDTGVGLFILYDGSEYDESWFETSPEEVELFYAARIFLNSQPTAGGLVGTLLICLGLSALGALLLTRADACWRRLRGAFYDEVIPHELLLIRATGLILIAGAACAALLI